MHVTDPGGGLSPMAPFLEFSSDYDGLFIYVK